MVPTRTKPKTKTVLDGSDDDFQDYDAYAKKSTKNKGKGKGKDKNPDSPVILDPTPESPIEDAPITQPAPSPTPSPSPTPAPTAPSSGIPGPTNTGVPAGTNLTVHHGDLVIRTAGAVIDSLDIRGFVRVEAPNVTIKNTIIRGRDVTSNAILIYAGTTAAAGLLVQDSELAAAYPSHIVNGVYGYGFTLRRVNIHNVIDSVHIFGDNVTVEDSWLHDNLHYANDPGWNGGHSHDDNIQIQKGDNIRIVNNTISGSYNAALMVTQDQGITSNVTLANNTIQDGGCTVNIAEKNKGPIQGIRIHDNRFGDSRFGCHVLVPATTPASISGNTTTSGSFSIVNRAQ